MKNLPITVTVISDTHNLLRPEVIRQIENSDAVIHAGDFSSRKTYDQIRAAMKEPERFYCVRGNNDHGWAEEMPEFLSFEIGDIRFHLIHNHTKLPEVLPPADLLIFGHSHRYFAEKKEDCFWLNPGSCGKRRFRQEISMAVLEIRDGGWEVRKIVLEQEARTMNMQTANMPNQMEQIPAMQKPGTQPPVTQSPAMQEENRLLLITEIYRRMDRGQKIDRMAAALKVEPDLVEEICRIRATHPGATPEDILNKMEVNRTNFLPLCK